MLLKKSFLTGLAVTCVMLSACVDESMLKNSAIVKAKLTDLSIPANFEWKTTAKVGVEVNASATSENGFQYTIAVYDKSPANGGVVIAKGAAGSGMPFVSNLTLPQSTRELYITQTSPSGITSGRTATINNNQLTVNFAEVALKSAVAKHVISVPVKFDVTVKNGDSNLNVNIPWNINTAMTYYVPADVTYNGSLTFTNWRDLNLTLYVKGTMNISGGVSIERANIVVLQGGKLTINGDLYTGTVQGETTIYIDNGAEMTVNGKFNYSNSKTSENNGTFTIASLDLNNSSKINNNGTLHTTNSLAVTNNGILTNNGTIVAENDIELSTSSTLINNCHINTTKAFILNNNTSTLTMAQGSLLESNAFNTTGGGRVTLEANTIIRATKTYLYGSTFIGPKSGNSLLDFDEVNLFHPSVTLSNNVQFAYRISDTDYSTSIINAAAKSPVTIVHGAATATIEPCACNGVKPAAIVDTDGDGVPDNLDEYPSDANRAYTSYFPNKTDFGTYVIEDLWPSLGDYDMNDLVLNFQIKYISNSKNLVTAMEIQYKPKAVGAAFATHAAAVSLDAILPSDVASVEGSKLTKGNEIFNLDGNGLEAEQKTAVFPIFDDYNSVFTITRKGLMLNTVADGGRATGELLKIVINFKGGIDPSKLLTDKNINLFMILKTNGIRKEIHLPNFPPTSLADGSFFSTFDDNTSLGKSIYYQSKPLKTGGYLMWGMIFPVDFKYPYEQTNIMKPYLRFADWAESGGEKYKDWYSNESSEYRDSKYLFKE